MTFSINNNIIKKPAQVSNQVWDEFFLTFNYVIATAKSGDIPTGDWDRPDLSDTELLEALQEVVSCLNPKYYSKLPCPDCDGRLVIEDGFEHCLDCDYRDCSPDDIA